MNDAIEDIGFDLQITKPTRRYSGGGAWVTGTIHAHGFQALVFPQHAENDEYEIGDSRISKLWLQRLEDNAVVFNWDRGADVPASDNNAQQIVEFLCAGLAESTFAV